MKKLLYLLLFIPSLVFSQASDAALTTIINSDVRLSTYNPGKMANLLDAINNSKTNRGEIWTATGTNTYTVTTGSTLSYSNKFSIKVLFTNGNSTAVTINPNTLGVKSIQKNVAGTFTDLVSGDINNGDIKEIYYDGTRFQLQTSGGGGSSYTFSTGLTNSSGTITADLSTGKSGGLTAKGGTASGENLTLQSTTNATRGKINFGSAGNSYFDEANEKLVLGNSNLVLEGPGDAFLSVSSGSALIMPQGTNANVAFFASGRPDYQSGTGIIHITNKGGNPTGAPTGGVYLWSDAGELKAEDTGGNIYTLTSGSSFTLTDGNGTTASGSSVDLGGTLSLTTTTIDVNSKSFFVGDGGNSGLHFNDSYITTGGYKYGLWSNSSVLGDGVSIGFGDLTQTGDLAYAGIFTGAADKEVTMSAGSSDGQVTEFWMQANDAGSFDIILSDLRTVPRGIEYESDYSSTLTSKSLTNKAYVDARLSGKNLPTAPSSGQNGQALRWNNGTPAWEYFTPSAFTPAALTKTDDSNVTVTLGGTPATSLLQATSLTLGWTGQLSGSRGGSGINNSGTFTWGSNNITFTTSGATTLTLPTSGTLATTSGIVTAVSGTSNRITSSGGTTPAIDISASYVGQSSITTLGTIGTGVWNGTDIAFANIAQGSALSVLGVTGNATADLASIAAGSDKQVLRRSGTSVGFGAIDLSSAAAVTGTLAVGSLPTTGYLQNGNGTTANGRAVDLGGSFTGTIDILSASGGGGGFTISMTQDSDFAALETTHGTGSGLFGIVNGDNTMPNSTYVTMENNGAAGINQSISIDTDNVQGSTLSGIVVIDAANKGIQYIQSGYVTTARSLTDRDYVINTAKTFTATQSFNGNNIIITDVTDVTKKMQFLVNGVATNSTVSLKVPSVGGTIATSASGSIALNATTGEITYSGSLPVGSSVLDAAHGGTGTSNSGSFSFGTQSISVSATGTAVLNLPITGMVQALTAAADATDADFTAVINTIKYLPAATLTANRTITMPTGSNLDLIIIDNNEAGFVWNMAGGSVYLSDGTTVITSLLANTNYEIRKVSGKWRIQN